MASIYEATITALVEEAHMADETLKGPSDDNSREILPVLQGYLQEAQDARRGGYNPRDLVWEDNLHLYWNRHDYTKKASWQAQETMPQVPTFVDRFAAALKEALVTGPTGFYTVVDPAGANHPIAETIKRCTDVWLTTCGHNQTGTCLGFPSVFEEQIKQGALMACSAAVVWKDDTDYGRVAIETQDPRKVWLDHTHRNLYRVRRTEIDKTQLKSMVRMTDKKGNSIYNLKAIDELCSHMAMEAQTEAQTATGHGHNISSSRKVVTLDEYIADVVSNDGTVLAERSLMVVANEQCLIRGPEPIPFWHKSDWMVYTPLVLAPFSVYGRTYMEDFGTLSRTFTRLTNLILDAVQTSSMRAYAIVPSMLINPEQIGEGIHPNKQFLLEDGVDPTMFMHAIDLGRMPAESFQVWQSIKNELREAADINEVGLGQFAPKGRTSATEIQGAQESSSAMIRSIAQTVEGRFLQPVLDLVWKTGMQHADKNDPMLMAAAGEDMWPQLVQNRKFFCQRKVTFQARGISTLITKNRALRAILQLFQFLAQSPELLAAFMQEADINKVIKYLFELSDVDMSRVTKTQQQMMVEQATQQMQQAAGQVAGVQPGTAQLQQAGQMAAAMGVGRAPRAGGTRRPAPGLMNGRMQ